jgi:hypothetical protein
MVVTPAARVARTRWWPAGLAWALWALNLLGLFAVPWLDHLSRQAGRPDLAQLTHDIVLAAVLGHLSATTVGAGWPAAGPATRWAGCCWPSPCR